MRRRGLKREQRSIFFDSNKNTPGCACTINCDFPCWQRVGLTGPCEQCGCGKQILETASEVPFFRTRHNEVVQRLRDMSAESRRFLRALGEKNA